MGSGMVLAGLFLHAVFYTMRSLKTLRAALEMDLCRLPDTALWILFDLECFIYVVTSHYHGYITCRSSVPAYHVYFVDFMRMNDYSTIL